MPFIKCKKCDFARTIEHDPTSYRCFGKMPEPQWGVGVDMSLKAYWPIINIEVDGCGEGELKKEKK